MTSGHNLRIILLIALCLRLSFFALVHPWTMSADEHLALNNDSALYHRLAIALLETGDFTNGPGGQSNALRTPGYPLFIAGIYAVFGHAPWLVIFFQIILDLLACALLYKLFLRTFGEKPAFFAAVLYAADPIVILYNSMFLSEALFGFTLILALTFGVRAALAEDGKPRWINFAIMAAFMGAATLIRPAAQYLPIFAVIYFLIAYRKQWKQALAYSLVFLAVFGAAISPWMIRNYKAFGAVQLSTSDSYNLLAANVAVMEAARRGVDVKSESKRLMSEADAMLISRGGNPMANPFVRAEVEREVALRYISKDPLRFAWHHIKGTAFMFANLGTSDFARMLRFESQKTTMLHWLTRGIVALFFLVSYSCIIAALIVAWKTCNHRVLLFLLIFALYFIVTPGAFALARFKLPALVFLYGFGGIGAVYLKNYLTDFFIRRAAK